MEAVNKLKLETYFAMQFLDMLTSRNFAGISILTSEIDPENFRLAILLNNLNNLYNNSKWWTVKCE